MAIKDWFKRRKKRTPTPSSSTGSSTFGLPAPKETVLTKAARSPPKVSTPTPQKTSSDSSSYSRSSGSSSRGSGGTSQDIINVQVPGFKEVQEKSVKQSQQDLFKRASKTSKPQQLSAEQLEQQRKIRDLVTREEIIKKKPSFRQKFQKVLQYPEKKVEKGLELLRQKEKLEFVREEGGIATPQYAQDIKSKIRGKIGLEQKEAKKIGRSYADVADVGSFLVPVLGEARATTFVSKTAGGIIGEGGSYVKENPVESVASLLIGGGSVFRGAKVLKGRKFAKQLGKLEKSPAEYIEVYNPKTKRLEIKSFQQYQKLQKEISVSGKLQKTESGKYILTGKGQSELTGSVPNILGRDTNILSSSLFEVGGTGAGKKAGSVGAVDIYSTLTKSTIGPQSQTTALFKKPITRLGIKRGSKSIVKQFKKPVLGGDIIKSFDTGALFKMDKFSIGSSTGSRGLLTEVSSKNIGKIKGTKFRKFGKPKKIDLDSALYSKPQLQKIKTKQVSTRPSFTSAIQKGVPETILPRVVPAGQFTKLLPSIAQTTNIKKRYKTGTSGKTAQKTSQSPIQLQPQIPKFGQAPRFIQKEYTKTRTSPKPIVRNIPSIAPMIPSASGFFNPRFPATPKMLYSDFGFGPQRFSSKTKKKKKQKFKPEVTGFQAALGVKSKAKKGQKFSGFELFR